MSSPADHQPNHAPPVPRPCAELFAEQNASYQGEVLPQAVSARLSAEAGIGLGWRAFAGDFGERVSVEQFGAFAAYQRLFEEFGITAQQVALGARTSLARLATAASPMRATSGSNEREW